MSLRNCSNLLNNIYTYLGYKDIKPNNEIDNLIDECLDEIKEISSFQYKYIEFNSIIDVLNKEPYLSYLNGCRGYYIACMTLGNSIDQRIKYYSKANMTKMIIFDACSSAYLEYLSDEYEKELKDNLGYRFCPGYNGSSITDLYELFKILKPEKIGIHLLDSNLMLPQKSMVGIIGIGANRKKSCSNCHLFEKCNYLKEGIKCYN